MGTIKNYWQNTENRKLLLVFVSFIIILIVLFIFFSFKILFGSSSSQLSPNTDPNGPDENYTREQKELEDQFLDDDKKSSRVSQLIDNLPYKGTNFSLIYDYGSLQFTLILLEGNESAGLEEFARFIKTNGIDASLIDKNLTKQTSPSL